MCVSRYAGWNTGAQELQSFRVGAYSSVDCSGSVHGPGAVCHRFQCFLHGALPRH